MRSGSGHVGRSSAWIHLVKLAAFYLTPQTHQTGPYTHTECEVTDDNDIQAGTLNAWNIFGIKMVEISTQNLVTMILNIGVTLQKSKFHPGPTYSNGHKSNLYKLFHITDYDLEMPTFFASY